MACPQFSHLVEIGPDLWNIRSSFKMFLGLLDIGTHMTLIRLNSGRFLAIDTVNVTPPMKQEIDYLTDSGRNLEAVIATHPFHTSFFRPFYSLYPNARYYGTPRHLRTITDIPWAGDVNDEATRRLWEPEVEMRIPAGAEFVDPRPPDKNHFSNVFVLHRKSRTVHNDDTVLFSSHPGFLMSLAGFKEGTMSFHPSIKNVGLYHTAEAPLQFSAWMETLLRDWDFDNLLSAHNGACLGGAKALLQQTLEKAQPLLQKLSKKNASHSHPPHAGHEGSPEQSNCG